VKTNIEKKANFIKRPNDPYCKNIEKLYEIRRNRLITKEDMNLFMPNWNIEM
jgi:hypothetical protein